MTRFLFSGLRGILFAVGIILLVPPVVVSAAQQKEHESGEDVVRRSTPYRSDRSYAPETGRIGACCGE